MAVPTVSSVTPNTGRTGGRQLIVIRGTNFQLPPAPPPLVFGQVTAAPNPSVEVLFGARFAREVRVLSSTLIHAISPISDPGAVSLTVRNVDQSGVGVPGETVTVEGAFTFGRPDTARKPTNETTLQRVCRQILVELQRQVIANVELTTHTDYDDSPSGANVAALASLPGIVLSGPRLTENREYSLNQKRQLSSGDELYPPRTVDLEFTLIGIDELQLPMLALMHECEMFFQRNIILSIAKDTATPSGEQIEYDMDMLPDGHFGSIGSPGNSNVRAFSGTFRIQGVDIDDDDMRSNVVFPVSDLSRAFGGSILNPPSPALLLGADGTGPAGVTMAPPIQSGPVLSIGLQDGIQQLGDIIGGPNPVFLHPSIDPNCTCLYEPGNFSIVNGVGVWAASKGPNATGDTIDTDLGFTPAQAPPENAGGVPRFTNYATQDQTLRATGALNGLAGEGGDAEYSGVISFIPGHFTFDDGFYVMYDAGDFSEVLIYPAGGRAQLQFNTWDDANGVFRRAVHDLGLYSMVEGNRLDVQFKKQGGFAWLRIGDSAWIKGAATGALGTSEFSMLVLGGFIGTILGFAAYKGVPTDAESNGRGAWAASLQIGG